MFNAPEPWIVIELASHPSPLPRTTKYQTQQIGWDHPRWCDVRILTYDFHKRLPLIWHHSRLMNNCGEPCISHCFIVMQIPAYRRRCRCIVTAPICHTKCDTCKNSSRPNHKGNWMKVIKSHRPPGCFLDDKEQRLWLAANLAYFPPTKNARPHWQTTTGPVRGVEWR